MLLFGTVFLTLGLSASAWTHPGLLVSSADISRIQSKLAAQKQPWVDSWNAFQSQSYSSSSYKASPISETNRLTNGAKLWRDTAAAFDLALRWQISKDEQYAEAAADILTAWAKTLKSFTGGDDRYLSAGLQRYELVNAAELPRNYEPFVKDGWDDFVKFATTVIRPVNQEFLNHEAPSEHNIKHFFANWELAQVASIQAIGVLTENQTDWDFANNYFKTGSGNGAVNNAITNIVEEPGTGRPLGQGQESGRDQGHSAMDYQQLAAVGQQAWNQGEDLFGYNNSRIL